MDKQEIFRILKANVGNVVDIVFDADRTSVLVLSVHRDGVLCRTLDVTPQQPPSEFWVALEDIERVELGRSAVN